MKQIFLPPLLLLLSFSFSYAQDHKEDADPHHDSVIHLGPIDVRGELDPSDILKTVPAVTNLHGNELLQKNQNSLGETLKNELGVNSTQFGPTASRPVIRGLEGDRIRILQNGVGVLDASGTSQDHAVPVNPLTAESVEIVRGPINLIYGSSAMGGVVNIVNSRIHKSYLAGPLSSLDARYETVNQGQSFAGKFDYGVNNWMLHADGNYVHTENVETPLGRIENSQSEQHSLAAGASYFYGDKNYLGLSYSDFQNIYGVVAEPEVEITLKQQRVDFATYYQTSGFFKGIHLKSAQSFYKHTEFDEGIAGTVFENSGNETRLELIQDKRAGASGIWGVQTTSVHLGAEGLEAFLPSARQQVVAPFIYEELDWESWQWTGSVRAEFTGLKTEVGPIMERAQENQFFALSSALGVRYALSSTLSTSINASLNQRAPNYQELYANGPHLAVGIFERGNRELKTEKSFGLEWSIAYKAKEVATALTLFNQDYSNFIALVPTTEFHDTDESGVTGDSSEDFLIYDYLAQRARLNGVEWKFSYRFLPAWSAVVMADYLNGENRQLHRPLPRISPVRTGFELVYEKNQWLSSLEWRRTFEQNRVAENETVTPGYNLINFNLSYNLPLGEESQLRLYTQMNNLTDEIARNHVSVIKDKVLLPGRSFILGARLIF